MELDLASGDWDGMFCHRNETPALCFTRICLDTALELCSASQEGIFSSVRSCLGMHVDHLCEMKIYSCPNGHGWVSLGMSKLLVKPHLRQQRLCSCVETLQASLRIIYQQIYQSVPLRECGKVREKNIFSTSACLAVDCE